ncbi:MAG: inositol monophosphatase family protein [Candidatus Omnitrophica bacterium]|nr:inositol monophosphatase family protein [Candidatus Omnitrophota bacterium]
MKDELSFFLRTGRHAAKRSGDCLLKGLGKKHDIRYKGRKNLVTEMDKKSEALIIASLRRNFPSHSILSEETGHAGKAGSEYRWVIDPLDGTTNYAHSFCFFAVSIALMKNDDIIAGIVYDPVRDEMFTAMKGRGAYLNKKRIHVSRVKAVKESLLSTGFPYKLGKEMRDNIAYFKSFMLRAQAIRRPGSASLDLCYVASGRFDGFWEMELRPWDTAAGALIVQEAGGKVTDFNGRRFDPFMKRVLASNNKIHSQMLAVLDRGR